MGVAFLFPAVAQRVKERVRDAISEPFFLDAQELPMSVSVGVGYFPDPNATREALFAADANMYRAKQGIRRAILLLG
ncbi:MAG TPA: diguanylate cyclase [Candidatus Baltobacteraceae bacterium]|jgi:GGDEF domain-containing protein